MAGKREKPEEIPSKLRQVDVLQGQGGAIAEEYRRRINLGDAPLAEREASRDAATVTPSFAEYAPNTR